MKNRRHFIKFPLAAALVATLGWGFSLPALAQQPVTLLNVSYDPTRELYAEFNTAFAKHWKAQAEQDAASAALRKSQVGSGDRSEKIRTYNFPQSRITDHRVNVTIHQLDAFMQGQIEPILEPLRAAYEAERLQQLDA